MQAMVLKVYVIPPHILLKQIILYSYSADHHAMQCNNFKVIILVFEYVDSILRPYSMLNECHVNSILDNESSYVYFKIV